MLDFSISQMYSCYLKKKKILYSCMLTKLCVLRVNGRTVCYLQSIWRQSDSTLLSSFRLQNSLLIKTPSSTWQRYCTLNFHVLSAAAALCSVQYKLPIQQLTKNGLCSSCNSSNVFKMYSFLRKKSIGFWIFKNVAKFKFFIIIMKIIIFCSFKL